jgi:hypothetical protein
MTIARVGADPTTHTYAAPAFKVSVIVPMKLLTGGGRCKFGLKAARGPNDSDR